MIPDARMKKTLFLWN